MEATDTESEPESSRSSSPLTPPPGLFLSGERDVRVAQAQEAMGALGDWLGALTPALAAIRTAAREGRVNEEVLEDVVTSAHNTAELLWSELAVCLEDLQDALLAAALGAS